MTSRSNRIPTPELVSRHERPSGIQLAAEAEAKAEAEAAAQAAPEVSAAPERAVSRPKRQPRPASAVPVPASAPRSTKPSTTVLLSLPEDDKQRMVATVAWTAPRTGIKSQQAFMRAAISDLCERMEREFNGGEPFPDPAQ